MMLLELISKNLLLEKGYIKALAKSASKRYKLFDINKYNGEKRHIAHPSKELKAVQRFLLDSVISKFVIHESAFAYKLNCNILKHASQHSKNNYLLRLDFKDFFPSIKSKDIRLYLENNSNYLPDNWLKEDSDMFIDFVCRYEKLTIGAPTSPSLSNALCYELDSKLNTISEALDVKYTRYADDLHFSTNKPNILHRFPHLVKEAIIGLSCPENLFLNNQKTIHSSKKRQRRVTGLILTPQGEVSLGRDRKRFVKSQIFKWDTLPENEKKSLKGLLTFCSDIEPKFINRLCSKYTATVVQKIIKYDTNPT